MSGLNISFKISALDDFSNTMSKLDSQTRGAFDAAGTLGVGFTAAGVGIAAGLGMAVKTAADFESQMSRVQAISGATDSEFTKLNETALQLGASTSKSASEVAIGMENMAAMGFSVNEIMSAMPGVISAAEASGSDLALTSEVVASALNGFGMEASEASKVADILAMTANISAASIDDMGYALKYVAPVASTLGISLEEVSAAVGIMTDAGIDGSSAGTALRQSLLSLNNPAKAQAEIMNELGFSMRDNSGEAKGLSEIVRDLTAATQGMTDAERVATVAKLVGTEASAAMITLMNAGAGTIDTFASKLENSGGAAKAAADIMMNNFKGALEQMGGAIETAQIAIGNVLLPALQNAAIFVGNMVDKFNALSPTMQTVIVYASLLAAGILLVTGPILILVGLIPSITAGFTAIATVFGVTAGALAGGIALFAGIGVAIAALGVALVVAYNKFAWFRAIVDTTWAAIKAAFNTALTFILGIVQTVMSQVTAFGGEQLAKFSALWNEHGAAIVALVQASFAQIVGNIQMAMGIIQGVFQMVWPLISGIVQVAWGLIQAVVSSGIDIIVGLIDAGMSALQGDWAGAWEAIKGIAEDIWSNIEGFFQDVDLYDIGADIIDGLVKGLGSMIGSVKAKVSEIAGAIPSGVKKFLGIHSPSRVMMALGGYTAEGMALGIGGGLKDVQQMAGAMANAAVPDMNRPSLGYGLSSGGQAGAAAGGTTINLTVNYSGSGSREDAQDFARFTEEYLRQQFSQELRVSGVKA